jgi:hypothetical protein
MIICDQIVEIGMVFSNKVRALSDLDLDEEMSKLESFLYALSDLELSKMTLKDLGPQALVSRNIVINNNF